MNQVTNQAEQPNTLPTLPSQFSEAFLKEKFAKVEKEVEAEVFDVTTEDGRKRIKAVAADISKSNKVLDTPMRDHLRELKALPKVLEVTARNSKARFEKLREGVLEPLKHAQLFQDNLLEWLNSVPVNCSVPGITSKEVSFYLSEIEKIDRDAIWKELSKKFKVAIETATTTATVTLERVEQQEKQAAELEDLRKKQAEAEKAENDRLVAEKAANKAREEAEAKALAEKQAVERRAVEAKQREEKAIADAAIEKNKAAEAEAREKQAIIDNKKAAELAEENAKIAAEKAAAEATEKERLRIEEENAQAEKLAKEREANQAYKAQIHRGALVALLALGISEEDGKTIIRAVARKEVPNMLVTY